MAEAIVQIEDVESRVVNTRNGQKTVYNISASDGRRYGTFNEDLGRKAGQLRGQSAVLDYSVRESHKDGKTYTNYDLKDIRANQFAPQNPGIILPEQTEKILQQYTASPQITTQEDKNVSIARAVALKAAVDLASGGVIEDPSKEGLILVSEYFTDWLLGKQFNVPLADVVTLNQTSDPGDTSDTTDELAMVDF